MSLNNTKSAIQSKTVWAGVAVIATAILDFFGYTLTDADIKALVDISSNIGTLGAGLAAIYFRISSTKKIAKK